MFSPIDGHPVTVGDVATTAVSNLPVQNFIDTDTNPNLLRIDPKIDLFNALNSHDYYSVSSAAFSPILDPNSADPTHSPALPAIISW